MRQRKKVCMLNFFYVSASALTPADTRVKQLAHKYLKYNCVSGPKHVIIFPSETRYRKPCANCLNPINESISTQHKALNQFAS
ncbi:hypothetical protein BCR43DRAFT_491758 [Syncephalastrum racemosum]|uniref:Secreted protein n=1 Tax=Syncephalastrum racemosum TaxID=13706 RepID=A0A1X2HCH6_SYNRA|nr:hypothetical protein BCR43DRAFT_491758 [Syncephalastrum racemosum]